MPASSSLNGVAMEGDENSHTSDDSVLIELNTAGGVPKEGQPGEVIATGLHSFAMPLIRYQLGNVAVRGLARCTCCQPFSSLQGVEGRVTDYFSLPQGRKLHPYLLFQPVLEHAYPWIRQYQLVQERKDLVVLRLSPKISGQVRDLNGLIADGQDRLGPGIEFQAVVTDHIQREKSGKMLTINQESGNEFNFPRAQSPTTMRKVGGKVGTVCLCY